MDQELKQRLIGAAVVTALAAIFIPMLFDDPIDDSGQMIRELKAPVAPVNTFDGTANKLPDNAAEVNSNLPEADGLEEPPAVLDNRNAADTPPNQDAGPGEEDEAKSEVTEAPSDEPQWHEENAEEDAAVPADEPDSSLSPAKTAITEEADKSVQKQSPKPALPESSHSKAASEQAPAGKHPADKKSAARLVRWYVQAGSFSKKENALIRQEALRKQGLPAFMETQNTDKGTLYRLKVGPELDKKRAVEIRNRLNKQSIKTIILAE